eukprot:Sdes_comp18935_c0_seq1m9422
MSTSQGAPNQSPAHDPNTIPAQNPPNYAAPSAAPPAYPSAAPNLPEYQGDKGYTLGAVPVAPQGVYNPALSGVNVVQPGRVYATQPGYQTQNGTTMYVVTTPVCQIFGTVPVTIQCPHCNHLGVSVIRHETSSLSWIMAGACCIFGCCLCAWIPFFVSDIQDCIHTCPHCNNIVGAYHR